MTTVEIVLITSSQLIRLRKLYATKAEQMLLTMHKSKPMQKKMYRKRISYIYGGFPVAQTVSKAMPTCLLQRKKGRRQPTQRGGKNSPESAK